MSTTLEIWLWSKERGGGRLRTRGYRCYAVLNMKEATAILVGWSRSCDSLIQIHFQMLLLLFLIYDHRPVSKPAQQTTVPWSHNIFCCFLYCLLTLGTNPTYILTYNNRHQFRQHCTSGLDFSGSNSVCSGAPSSCNCCSINASSLNNNDHFAPSWSELHYSCVTVASPH